MSKKHRKTAQPVVAPPVAPQRRTGLYVAAGIVVLAVVAGLVWFVTSPKAASRSAAELAALQRPHAATIGDPAASVHIVEFLDPACETCAQFYPLVKNIMKDHPRDIRLSVRLVPFHRNSDIAVKALEAAKLQDKFWSLLERLLATQGSWTIAHRVDPERLWAVLRSTELDVARLPADMESPGVLQSIALDMQDAKTLKVTATPEYFVNGRGLPEFGFDHLRRLIGDELGKVKR
jgi:protein-disulfide isomerase